MTILMRDGENVLSLPEIGWRSEGTYTVDPRYLRWFLHVHIKGGNPFSPPFPVVVWRDDA